jgi:hypothetical protein
MIYPLAFGAGLLISIGIFVWALLNWPAELSEKAFIVYDLVYAGVGFGFAARSRVREWLVALCLSAVYLMGLAYAVKELLRYDEMYGHLFWITKFYFSSAFLLASVPLAAFVGTRFGSRRTLLRIAPLICLCIVAYIAVIQAHAGLRPAKQSNYSLTLATEPPEQLLAKLDIKVGLQITDEPMHFRYFPSGGGGDGSWSLTVIQKGPNFAPSTNMKIDIDGKELENTMWPINGPNGSSRIDYSSKQDYSEIVNWRIGLSPDLSAALVNARHISMTWGTVDITLSEQQVAGLREFVRAWGKILHDEGVLCTNPNCVQGRFNSSH